MPRHALEFNEQALKAFFQYADKRFFSSRTGTWKHGRDYGRCTFANAAPMHALRSKSHDASVYGGDAEVMSASGMARKFDLMGGHDWLVVDNRWIIDVWAHGYLGIPKIVYDLHNPEDKAAVNSIYPPMKRWVKMEDFPDWWKPMLRRDWTDFKRRYRPSARKVVETLLEG